MRIRKAVIAGATAFAVALSGASIASAEEAGNTAPETNAASSFLELEKEADGRAIFGSSHSVTKGEETETLSSQPNWAKVLYGIGVASAVITVLGGLVGPVLNFIKFGPVDFKF